jgi:hypothetical protein
METGQHRTPGTGPLCPSRPRKGPTMNPNGATESLLAFKGRHHVSEWTLDPLGVGGVSQPGKLRWIGVGMALPITKDSSNNIFDAYSNVSAHNPQICIQEITSNVQNVARYQFIFDTTDNHFIVLNHCLYFELYIQDVACPFDFPQRKDVTIVGYGEGEIERVLGIGGRR